jgi:hypothetical protein
MKRKRVEDCQINFETELKKRKISGIENIGNETPTYIFLDIFGNDYVNDNRKNMDYDLQEIKVFDLSTLSVARKSVQFNNWIYIEYDEKKIDVNLICKMNGVLLVEEKLNFEHSSEGGFSSIIIPRVLKISIIERMKSKIWDEIKKLWKQCKIFEYMIERFTRFITVNNLCFLTPIQIISEKLVICKSNNQSFCIPITLYWAENEFERKCKRFGITEHSEIIVFDDNSNDLKENVCNIDTEINTSIDDGSISPYSSLSQSKEEFPGIVCVWDYNEVKFQVNPFLLFFLKDICFNFLRCLSTNHCDKQSISPHDLFYLFHANEKWKEEREKVIIDTFISSFKQLIHFASSIPCPMCYLLSIPNRKMIFDIIYLANCDKFKIILDSPIKQESFPSGAIIQNSYIFTSSFDLEPTKQLSNLKQTTFSDLTIMELDYASMYPGFFLKYMKKYNKLKPLFETYQFFFDAKKNEKDKIKKTTYKLVLNASGYGSFAISDKKTQFKIRSNIEVGKRICKDSKDLILETIKYFEKFSIIIGAHTDSLFVKGSKSKIIEMVKEWNKKLKNDEITSSNLEIKNSKIEKLLFFNNVAHCYVYVDEFGKQKFQANGLLFNSIKIPKFYRDEIANIFMKAITESSSIKELKIKYFELVENVKNTIRQIEVDLFDILKTTSITLDNGRSSVGFNVGKFSRSGYIETEFSDALNCGKKKVLDVNKVLLEYLNIEFNKYVRGLSDFENEVKGEFDIEE